MVTDETDAFALLSENRRAIQKRLADRFHQANTAGDLPSDEDPEELARFLITLTTGFAIRAADGEPQDALLTLARRAARTIPAAAAHTASATERHRP